MRLKTLCLAALVLAVVCVTPASALEYTMDAPDDYLFARPTSDTTIYEHEDPNVDRSKNTALIPARASAHPPVTSPAPAHPPVTSPAPAQP